MTYRYPIRLWLVGSGLLATAAFSRATAQTASPSAVRSPTTAISGFVADRRLHRLRSWSDRVESETYRQQAGPRGSNARIAAQIGGGALAAGLLGFVAWQLLDDPEGPDRRVKGDAGYTPNANSAYAAGSFVGSVLAVYLIGRGDGSRGSLSATALGAGLATIPLALGRHEPYLPILGLVLGAPAQAVGATIGYQLTRVAP
ncbi:MAG: hypothetical protein ABR499_03030 [Gemmatimonadaceae bacterium]